MTADKDVIVLLTEIRDTLLRMEKDADTLAERRAKKTARQARYRAKLASTVASTETHVASTKGEREERKTFPPAPPLEEKEGKGEKGAATVCACAREGFPAEYESELVASLGRRVEMRSHPCLAEMLAWTHDVLKMSDKDELVRQVFDEMRGNGWTIASTGKPITNWASFLRRCLINNLPPKPKRKPDEHAAPSSSFRVKRADNYTEPTEEAKNSFLRIFQ